MSIIVDELNVFELEYVIKQFDFAIVSRYHSLVHCYKHSIPAIGIGWAEKYKELTSLFNQECYYLDYSDACSSANLKSKTINMLKSFENEKQIISQKLDRVQEVDAFGCLKINVRVINE